MSVFTIETRAGATIQAGPNRITPFSRVAQLILPGGRAGFIWNRPVSVLVQSDDGSEQVLAIPDPTRQAQLTFLGVMLGAAVLFGFIRALARRKA